MTDVIPADLLPADGRFGCGPSRIRPAQLAALETAGRTVLGTSHRQAPVRDLVRDVREGVADLLGAPDGWEVVLGDGGATAFWDATAFGLTERRSQHCVFGEFGAKAAASSGTPWLEAPDVRRAEPGGISAPEPVEGVDLYAWPQNETSTGVAAPVRRVQHDGALTLVDATSAAGGMAVDLAETDGYYFSPQKNFGADGGLWLAVLSPAAVERSERIAASGRYIPEFLSLTQAVTNSRLQQTLNTPALATLVMLRDQIDWIRGNGGLQWAAARTAASAALLYEWAERSPVMRPFVPDPAHRSPVVVTLDFDGADAAAIATTLRANGIVDVEPYRKLKRNQLRVSTFVSVEPDDVRALIASVEWILEHTSAARPAG